MLCWARGAPSGGAVMVWAIVIGDVYLHCFPILFPPCRIVGDLHGGGGRGGKGAQSGRAGVCAKRRVGGGKITILR